RELKAKVSGKRSTSVHRHVAVLLALAAFGLPFAVPAQSRKLAWSSLGRDPQHSANATVAAQSLTHIRWQTPVDLSPQYSGDELLIHYGSPLVSARNTVVVPVKT